MADAWGNSLNGYLRKMDRLFETCDGNAAALLLSFRDAHVYNHNLQLQHPEAECEHWFQPPMDELAAAHLKCCWAVSKHDLRHTTARPL